MRTVWKVAKLTLLILCCFLMSAQHSMAQKKKPFEIFRGSEGTRNGKPIPQRIPVGGVGKQIPNNAAAKPATNATSPARPKRSPEAARQYQQRLETTRILSRGLADRSFDAYRRGLMPLEDHLEQLNLATRSNYQFAMDTNGQKAVAIAHRQYMARVVDALEAARKIVGFEVAPGFTADVALARAMMAQADVEIASLESDQDALEAATARAVGFARQHLEIRRIDAQLGFTSLAALTNAIMLTRDGFSRGRDVLSDSVDQRRKWARKNSEGGLGRSDQLAESELELARFNYYAALDAKDDQQALEQLNLAKQAADRMYSAKLRYNRTGTASVYQVARAWSLRREVHQMAGQTATAKEDSLKDKTDFQQVIELANATTDQRGRNAADVSYVALLKVVNQY
jgi:hypothetical protein